MATVSGNIDCIPGIAGQELLNIYNITCLNQLTANIITASGTITGSGLIRAANVTDATANTSACSLYTDGGFRASKNAYIGGSTVVTGTLETNNTADATGLTSAAALQSSGGLAVALTSWMQSLVVTTAYYSRWYVNSTQTIARANTITITAGLTSAGQSSSVMQGGMAATAGTTTAYTMPYSGQYSVQANFRVTPGAANCIVELAMACSNSTIVGTTAKVLGRVAVYAPSSTQIAPSTSTDAYFNAGDVVTFTLYCAQTTLTLNTGTDCTIEICMKHRTG
jgi:hypothetical protein